MKYKKRYLKRRYSIYRTKAEERACDIGEVKKDRKSFIGVLKRWKVRLLDYLDYEVLHSKNFILKDICIGGYKKNFSVVSAYFGNKFLRDNFLKYYLLDHIFMFLYMQTCLISHIKIRSEYGKIVVKIRLFYKKYYIVTEEYRGKGFENLPKGLRRKVFNIKNRKIFLDNSALHRFKYKTKHIFFELVGMYWIRNYWEYVYSKNCLKAHFIWLNFEPFEYLVGVLLFDLRCFYGDKIALAVEPVRNDEVDGNLMLLYILGKLKQGYSIRSTIKYFSRELKRLVKLKLLRGWKFKFKGRFRKRPRKKMTQFKVGIFSELNSFRPGDYSDAGFGYTKLKYSAIGLRFCLRRRRYRRRKRMWRIFKFS